MHFSWTIKTLNWITLIIPVLIASIIALSRSFGALAIKTDSREYGVALGAVVIIAVLSALYVYLLILGSPALWD
jgi:hypothetical protein